MTTPAHKLISAHRCICGWEGDNAITHITDVTITEVSAYILAGTENESVLATQVLKERERYAALVEATQGSIQGQIIHSLVQLVEGLVEEGKVVRQTGSEEWVELDQVKLAPGITFKDARKTYEPRT